MFLNLMIFRNVSRDLGFQDPSFLRVCVGSGMTTPTSSQNVLWLALGENEISLVTF